MEDKISPNQFKGTSFGHQYNEIQYLLISYRPFSVQFHRLQREFNHTMKRKAYNKMINMILPCCNYGDMNREDKKQGNKLKRKIKGEDE